MLAEAPVPVIRQNEWSVEHDWGLKEFKINYRKSETHIAKQEELKIWTKYLSLVTRKDLCVCLCVCLHEGFFLYHAVK